MKTNPIKLTAADIAKFWTFVDRRAPSECWPYRGRKNRDGYGQFTLRRRRPDEKTFLAHRVALVISIGRDLGLRLACHHCDNPPCCNPAHLFEGDHSANHLDAIKKRRWVARDMRNSKNPNAKLSDDAVAEIRRRYAAGGSTQAKIAAEFSIHPSFVSALVRGAKRPVAEAR